MYKKILVAIDDSETSRSALREAMHIAKTSNAKLFITHVSDETALNMHNHVFAHMADADNNAVSTLTHAGQELLVEAMKSATGIDAEAILLHATNRRISETIIEKAKELAPPGVVPEALAFLLGGRC
ncbi:MAG: universal stress protein [Betaproteobacteria bacterium]|nr:universal stress protein [Betaproteobacteria bacterium]